MPSDAKGKLIVKINNLTNEVEFKNNTAYLKVGKKIKYQITYVKTTIKHC